MTNQTPKFLKPSGEIRDLRLLEELERNPIISQRELSHKFNIALGITNACLRRMVREGWIRISGLSHRRIGYYLTPKGFGEKARLTLHLISYTVQHYSELKKILTNRFLEMQQDGLHRIVFYGVSDEMEVAYITLQGVSLQLIGIVEDDEKMDPKIVLGYEIEPVSRIREIKPDGVLITSLERIEEKKEKLRKLLPEGIVHIHDICLRE